VFPKKNIHNSKYHYRKILFWVILISIYVCIGIILLFGGFKKKENYSQYITVGACGCVKERGVYRLSKNADLASLIYSANGLTLNANISEINFEQDLSQDSVYHIPCQAARINLDTIFRNTDFKIEIDTINEKLTNFLLHWFSRCLFFNPIFDNA
jgi:hypothetical protein